MLPSQTALVETYLNSAVGLVAIARATKILDGTLSPDQKYLSCSKTIDEIADVSTKHVSLN